MLRVVLIITLAFIALSMTASATVLHVPSEYSTIQAGIDASVNGDTVLVAPGIYHEHLNFSGKGILLKSVEGPATTITRQLDGVPLVTFNTNEGPSSIIQGFTIFGSTGAGIYCYNASPIIQDNIIENNTDDNTFPPVNEGAGISCWQSSAIVIYCSLYVFKQIWTLYILT
jgi:pectin methylesterase-like acyl-CoA thioesterase